MSATTAGPATGAPATVRALDALVGRWASTGEMVDPETGARTPVSGTDEYAWLEGGWFLVHRVDVTVGGEPVRVLELIGEPAPQGGTGEDQAAVGDAVLCRAYDATGTVGLMRATVDPAGVWRFSDDAMRATLVVDPGGDAMRADWELAGADGAWRPWMRMTFARLPEA